MAAPTNKRKGGGNPTASRPNPVQEVIVIDDSPPPPSSSYHHHRPLNTPPSSYGSIMTDLPPALSTRSKRALLRTPSIQRKHRMLPHSPGTTPTTKKKKRKVVTQDKMMRTLGQGTFGKVIECFDRVKRGRCAIKVIRSIKRYRDASTLEMRVLQTLRKHDPSNLYQCIHLDDWFEHEHHICMVFELLGQSVFDFLKSHHFKPFSLCQIQHFAIQLFTSIEFLHRLKLVHTDLKPENVLLINRSEKPVTTEDLHNTEIRLIDFGSATFEKEFHSAVVSTRHYRAPEIILGNKLTIPIFLDHLTSTLSLATGWSYPCDIWSIGCMLIEFFTGEPLFQTHDNLEHLAMMQIVLGKIPHTMICKSKLNGQTYFKKDHLLYPAPETKPENIKYVNTLRPLYKIIPTSLSKGHVLFLDLLERILVYDPRTRISASEALQHPFLHHTF
ncbi:hypothetical protein [Absidia glauca]|uniref:Protein kinase domain-containing protein n=1 Tax=Absidia glauca TaxID=4829 RepID=A0A163J9M1_ABSGL|nr:hypothetical protein [Absidia glauca]